MNSAIGSSGAGGTYLWRPVQGWQRLLDYLNATGASSASNFQLLYESYLSSDGTAIAGTAVDANGVDYAFYATIATPAQPPFHLSSLLASPSSRVGGAGNTISLVGKISGQAPNGGVQISLQSSSGSVSPHVSALAGGAGIFIPLAGTVGTDWAPTSAVSVPTTAYVRGTLRNYSMIAQVNLIPADLYTPSLSASSVTGGQSVTGTLKLNGDIASSSVQVAIQCTNPGVASVPATATITSPNHSTTFTIQTQPVTVATVVTIKATYRNSTKNVTLTVTP